MYNKSICLVCFVLVLGTVITSGANAADPNLVGWWKFDEGSGDIAIDSSSNEFDIPLQDNLWADGIFGGAVHFPGQGQGQRSGFVYSNNVITVCAWVWHEAFRAGQVERYVTAEPEIAVIRKEADGRLHFYVNVGGGLRHLHVADVLTEGRWHHVAGTWDGSTQRLYLDGVEIANQKLSGALGTTSGVRLSNTPEPLNGMLDDARIYDRALTQQDISVVMRGPEYPYASTPSPADGAVNADTWVSLSWRAGDFAVSHDVYFGENYDDVNDGTWDSEVFIGNQDLNSTFLIAGFPGYPYPDGLVPGTTYYWRVDEVNDAEPNSPWKGKVWSFMIPPKNAYKPSPVDGSRFIDPENPSLSWTAGFGAKLHTVYFGDDYDTVANATGGSSMAATNFSPGPLEPEKMYYWRVDEFEAPVTHKGDVWSFTTAKVGGGLRAEYYHWSGDFPPPEPFQVFVTSEIVPEINWNWGEGSPNDLVNADDFAIKFTGEVEAAFTETYTFCLMTDDGQKLWVDGQPITDMWVQQGMVEHRGTIDLVAGQRYSIELWMYEHNGGAGCELRWLSPGTPKQIIPQAAFSPPVRAMGSSPPNGATGTKMTPILKWGAGDSAVSHEVYFGTDANAVAYADKTSPEYKGTRALGDESYDPGKLAWHTTYYWRVDEVNDLNPDSPWVGNLWSFTTGDFLVIDDFEDYDAGANQIWYSWIDGLGFGAQGTDPYNPGNGTGAAVGDEASPSYTEQTIVHSGRQSMPLAYDNNKQGYAKYSEAELTLIYPRDWTEEGVAELSLWFYGDPNNSNEPLYVAVSNSAGNPAVVVHDDPAVTTINTWTEWVIPLQAFADQGITLSNVDRIAIGFGTRGNITVPGGSGKMIFDDIRLYRPREAAE